MTDGATDGATSDEPIRRRTDGERRAFQAGYAHAIRDVADHGLDLARLFLRATADAGQSDDAVRAGEIIATREPATASKPRPKKGQR